MNILIIKKIHSMILSKSTGKPKELALKLNVSERPLQLQSTQRPYLPEMLRKALILQRPLQTYRLQEKTSNGTTPQPMEIF